ncbi:MAG: hypothetical protein ACI9IV_001457 [Paracoccaceae bacterium]|jgi:hypothetical protein
MPQDSHDDFAFEHAPGLPGPLPKGEQILWQGRPNAWRLAVESLMLKWVIAYFAVLIVWRVGSASVDHSAAISLASAVPLIGLGLAATGILFLVSWAQARATVYTITTERVLLRIGAALQVTFNLPFKQLENAALDMRKDGTGTIALEPKREGGQMLSYLVLWPHLRPWHVRDPQPAFRCIPDAHNVAELLADAAESQMSQPQISRVTAQPVRQAQTENQMRGLGGNAVPAE